MRFLIARLLGAVITFTVLVANTVPLSTQETLSPETYMKLIGRALDAVSQKIPAHARHRIEFSVNLFLAHELWIRDTPLEVLVEAVDALKEAGVDRIDINPGLFPWLNGEQEIIAKYDAVVQRIRLHGLKLAINPQYSAFKNKVASFAEWRERAVVLYTELARRYKPDIFVVAHEPSTMASRMKNETTIADWTGFVRVLSKAIKTQSPASRIGAGGLASEREYIEAFIRMPEVDVVTLDIYGVADLEVCNGIIRSAYAMKKPVYIEETWRPPYYRPGPGLTPDAASLKNVGNKMFERLDGQWLRVMTAYAQANRLEAITPVWIFPLFNYSEGNVDLDDPLYNRAVMESVMKGERTATFRALQELIRENKGLPR